MAASTLSNFIPFLSSTAPPPPLPKSPPPAHLSLCFTSSSNKSRGCFSAPLTAAPEHQQVLAVVNPALAHANTLFFSGYNVQVVVEDNEPEERLLNRFRREVMRAGIIQECKRRRFFENKQEEAKRRVRDAAKRNRRRRGPQSRFIPQNKSDSPEGTKKHEDDNDNWDLPEADVPYLN